MIHRIKVVGEYAIDVVPTGRGARITWQPTWAPPRSAYRAWCYYGSVTAAVLAAQAWDGLEGSEPAGYDYAWALAR